MCCPVDIRGAAHRAMDMKKPPYKHYVLSILLVVMAFNFVDRLALAVVTQDIKTELALSDTQLGLLTGIAFALFYSVMGIPIARWADRGNRVTIISLTTALWSVAVMLCGFIGNFFHLMLIRIGVAVGEAGCIPPAHSLIADYFSRAERPRAVAIYMMGAPLSAVFGYFLAGWLNEIYGWRAMFVILGLPGLGLAALAWFTLREPRLAKPAAPDPRTSVTTQLPQPRLAEVFRVLWMSTSYRHLLMCFSVMSFFSAGSLQWNPTFFIRSYGLQTGELGTWFAVIYGLGGIFGVLCGGELASRFAPNNERLQLKLSGLAYLGFGVFSAAVYLSSNYHWAFAFLTIGAIGGYLTTGPLFATLQTLVPGRMRATSLAIMYLFSNLIGVGLGPLIVGVLSDALRPLFGEESLRYALLALCPGYLWAALHIWRASRSIAEDLKAAHGAML